MDELPRDSAPVAAHGDHRSEDIDLEPSSPQADPVSDDAVKVKLIEILEESDLSVTTGTFDLTCSGSQK